MNPSNALNININIRDFERQFNQEYEFLYDNHDRVAGYGEAVAAFDEFMETRANAQFVRAFVRWRGDFLSSDREAAAFMFALEALSGAYQDDGPMPFCS